MKIGIISDIHLPQQGTLPRPSQAGDVMILAGDIGVGLQGVTWARNAFDVPVIYVAGNHEYYGRNIDTLDEALKSNCLNSNIRVLQDDSCVIDGVRFLGCTLWTDFALFGDAREYAAEGRLHMNDFRLIATNRGGPATPNDTLVRHQASRAYLERALGQPFDGPTVVVTHHTPSLRCIAPRFRRDTLTPCYASNLEPLVARSGAVLWVHGHVHDSFDYRLGETRVVCNPKGYPFEDKVRESPAFRWDYTVEVPV